MYFRTKYNARSNFWDITPCSPLKVNRRFGGAGIASRALLCYLLHPGVVVWLILRNWSFRWHVPPKRQLSFNGQHGVIYHKTEHLVTTAAITSNPVRYMTRWRTRGSYPSGAAASLHSADAWPPSRRDAVNLEDSRGFPRSLQALKSTTTVSFCIFSNVIPAAQLSHWQLP
jgi:hypothetical protein